MENFGTLFSIPAAFFAIVIYRFFLIRATLKYGWISTVFKPASYLVLALLGFELLLLCLFGAVQSRHMIGPLFEGIRIVVFFLGPPALANLMLIRPSVGPKWYVVALSCTALAFALVMMNLYVSDRLDGIDDHGGPYNAEISDRKIAPIR
jgi:hypothetical protein